MGSYYSLSWWPSVIFINDTIIWGHIYRFKLVFIRVHLTREPLTDDFLLQAFFTFHFLGNDLVLLEWLIQLLNIFLQILGAIKCIELMVGHDADHICMLHGNTLFLLIYVHFFLSRFILLDNFQKFCFLSLR
jgi:hypothetical protein